MHFKRFARNLTTLANLFPDVNPRRDRIYVQAGIAPKIILNVTNKIIIVNIMAMSDVSTEFAEKLVNISSIAVVLKKI